MAVSPDAKTIPFPGIEYDEELVRRAKQRVAESQLATACMTEAMLSPVSLIVGSAQ